MERTLKKHLVIPSTNGNSPPTATQTPSPSGHSSTGSLSSMESVVNKAGPDRTDRGKTTAKKPRDSLCIKRYENLHAIRLQTQPQTDPEPVRAVGTAVSSQHKLSVRVEETHQVSRSNSVENHNGENDSGWGSLEYHEVSPPNSQSSKTESVPEITRKDSIPIPEPNTKYMWDAGKFLNGLCEVSLEENLAELWRKRRSHQAVISPSLSSSTTISPKSEPVKVETVKSVSSEFMLMKSVSAKLQPDSRTNGPTLQPKPPVQTEHVAVRPHVDSPSVKELMLAEKLRVAEQLLESEMGKRIAAEQNVMKLEKELASAEMIREIADKDKVIAEESREIADLKVWGLEEKLHALELERHAMKEKWDSNLNLATLKYHTARDILQSITTSLVIFCRDLPECTDHLDVVVQFAHTLHSKVSPIISSRSGHGSAPDEHLIKLQSAVQEVVHVAENCRKKVLMTEMVKQTESIPQTRPVEVTFGDDENGIASGTRSSLAPSSQQSDRTNPLIKALWNQTNQTMNCTNRDPARPNSDPSKSRATIFDETTSSNRSVFPEPEDRPLPPVPPVRQSLVARKSIKQQLQTSAMEDVENMPGSAVPETTRAAVNFNIFMDQSCGAERLPRIEPGREVDVEKESDDDSENTPPPNYLPTDMASKSEIRSIKRVLNESAEHPGVPADRLTEKDFIEVVESDGDYEPIVKRHHVLTHGSHNDPVYSTRSNRVFSAAPQPLPRKSLGLGDFQDEFNMTCDHHGRRSFGVTDQTLPFDFATSQSDFFRSIDPKRHMASTPLVQSLTEEQAVKERMRQKPRVSYLPPTGASKLLSPITEGSSRENKSGTSSCRTGYWHTSKTPGP